MGWAIQIEQRIQGKVNMYFQSCFVKFMHHVYLALSPQKEEDDSHEEKMHALIKRRLMIIVLGLQSSFSVLHQISVATWWNQSDLSK